MCGIVGADPELRTGRNGGRYKCRRSPYQKDSSRSPVNDSKHQVHHSRVLQYANFFCEKTYGIVGHPPRRKREASDQNVDGSSWPVPMEPGPLAVTRLFLKRLAGPV